MTRYDPQKQHRRSIRLKGWDYRRPGWYFVTINVKNRECLFGRVENQKMILNQFGRIVDYHWQRLPNHFKHIELDEFYVMPDHLHGIIHIIRWPGGVGTDESAVVGAKHFLEENSNMRNKWLHGKDLANLKDAGGNASPLHSGTQSGSLSSIMQNFALWTTRKINRVRHTPGVKLWQRDYYDRIIRNETELKRIRRYIIENPLNWTGDECIERT